MISDYLIAPLMAWGVAQFVKFAGAALRAGVVDFQWLWRSGGLPSSHSAIVSALATTVLVLEGVDSPEFAIATILTIIVLYDAVGVRRAAGMNSQSIVTIKDKVDFVLPEKFKVVLGHKPIEMFTGVSLGIVVGLVVTYTSWSSRFDSAPRLLSGAELIGAFLVSAVLLVVGAIIMSKLKNKAIRKLPTTAKIRTWTIWGLLAPAIVILLLSGAASQEISPLAWRLWVWIVFSYVVLTQMVLSYVYYRHLPRIFREESEQQKTATKRRRSLQKTNHKNKQAKKRK